MHRFPFHRFAKAVSLSFELEAIAYALEGARLLSQGVDEGRYATENDGQRAIRAVEASLSMVLVRLQTVGEVVRGGLNPRQIWAPHNATVLHGPLPEDNDIRLKVWSLQKQVERSKEALQRAEARLAQSSKSSTSNARKSGVVHGRKRTGKS